MHGHEAEASRLFRISAGFVLDQVKVGRWGRDFIDGLIMTAVTQANVAPIMADPVLQQRYAAYADPPPDELRRPISIHATAHSLGLPYETVRRRVVALSRIGVYRITAEGVVVPSSHLFLLGHKGVVEAAYVRLRSLHERLCAQGLLPQPPDSYDDPPDAPPLRLVVRIAGDYMLRYADALTAYIGDPACAMIWLETFRNNREHWPDNAEAGGSAELRGARMAVISSRLGMPAETVRRRVAQLVAMGACEWDRTGLIVPATALETPEFARLAKRVGADLIRMYAALANYGVIAAWQAEGRSEISRAA